jgi:hypothetical protein
VFVGAQPGAGKTQSKQEVLTTHPDAVQVIGDDFRPYHPDYRDLMRSAPLEMPDVTAQASGAWVEMSIAYLQERRRSVLLETTMRQSTVVESTARAFRVAGYGIEVRALAVPGAVSRLGTVTRYLGDGSARTRWTPTEAHDTAFDAMPGTLEKLVSEELADRVLVTTRSGRVLLDRRISAASAAHAAADARRAVELGRSPRELSAAEGHDWVRMYLRAAAMSAPIVRQEPELLRTMRRLARAAGPIIRATHEPRQRQDALARVQTAAAHVAAAAPRRRPANTDTGPITGPTGAGPGREPTL